METKETKVKAYLDNFFRLWHVDCFEKYHELYNIYQGSKLIKPVKIEKILTRVSRAQCHHCLKKIK